MRRPVNVPPARLGDGDAEHARRGVGPAQDYGCPIGTPVYAMFPVVRLVKSGGPKAKGGHTLTGYAANGDSWTVQHLSAWQTSVSDDGRVALSGDSGTDVYGAHVHAFVTISGRRMNPETYLAQLASSGAQPFEEDDDMYTQEDRERDVKAASDSAAAVALLTEVRQILYNAGLLQASGDVSLIRKAIFDKADGTTNHWDGLAVTLQKVADSLGSGTDSTPPTAADVLDEMARRLRE